MNDFLIGKSTCAKCGKTFPYIKATLYAPKWCNDCISRYEKAEAEGRLVVLPCKVGDTVYLVNKIYEYGGKCRYEIEPQVVEMFSVDTDEDSHSFEAFGKTVFLTREEAEAALEGESK